MGDRPGVRPGEHPRTPAISILVEIGRVGSSWVEIARVSGGVSLSYLGLSRPGASRVSGYLELTVPSTGVRKGSD